MPRESPQRRRRAASAALTLTALQALLLLRTAWDKSDTSDEPYYLATAVRQWAFGDFSACDAPVLPKWGFAAALRLSDPRLFDLEARSGRDPLWSRPLRQTRRNLLAGRAATIAVTLAGGLWLWSALRRFGEAAALASLALWTFSPSVLANGSLATLDAWATASGCLALLAVVRLLERPRPARAAQLGAVLGLAAATKATMLALAPVAFVALLVATLRGQPRPPGGPLPAALAALAGAGLATLWALYLFQVGMLDAASLCGRLTELPSRRYGPLPFSPWFEGLVLQLLHGGRGHLSYLFGATSASGWWWFYLAALGLKTTLGAQALAALSLAAWLRVRRCGPSAAAGGSLAAPNAWIDAGLLAFPVLLIGAMSLGSAQNGIRYVLPAFPFLMAAAGRGFAWARQAWGRRGALAAAAALATGALESLALHPHHLMFFNLWAGGPTGGPRYLVHGDDWGQDQRRLAAWQAAQRPWRLYYTFYNGNPRHWGVNYEDPPCAPRPGYYALHAVEVHRPKRLAAGCLDWLTVEPPDARLGYSIYLYQVNRERIARLAAERETARPFWRSGAS
jgi:hypothetical protein